MYLTEIAPLSIRGAMGVLCPLGITVGVLVAQILGLESVLGKFVIIAQIYIFHVKYTTNTVFSCIQDDSTLSHHPPPPPTPKKYSHEKGFHPNLTWPSVNNMSAKKNILLLIS